MAFKGKLFPAQIPAANLLCKKKRVLLAHEQGCGKTIISLAALDKLLDLGYIKTALVVAPSSIAWQWQEKLYEFTDRDCNYVRAQPGKTRSYSGSNICITGYSLFRRDYDQIMETPWDLIITDECQEFKNNKSKTHELLCQVNREIKPRYFWGETGTVISTKLEELYSILYVIKKGFLPPWPVFEERHVIRDEHTKAILRYKNLKSLATYLPQRVDRKTHADLGGQMPKIVAEVHTVKKTPELKNAEKNLLDKLDGLVENLSFTSEGELITPRRDPEVSRAFHEVRALLASKEKLEYGTKLATRILQENATNRIAFFSFYKEPLYTLQDLLSDSGIGGVLFTGDQSVDKKREAIRSFRTDVRVLLASNAGKSGLDIPELNNIIHIDTPFSWEVLDQRNKRGTRASSIHKTCVVNYLLIEDSLEQYYLQVTNSIGRLAESVHHGNSDEIVIKTESARKYLHGLKVKDKPVSPTETSRKAT